MKTLVLFNRLCVRTFCILVATCTNDLVIHAKQVNYFEMFLLSFVVECKRSIQVSTSYHTMLQKLSKTNTSFDWLKWNKFSNPLTPNNA
ncbi:hypothetical protein GOQ30_04810 [Flavobacterium sp. TP390]|uniref:Uncharacterized protein n=1 Tax=Flavobacterium profundi TaxID=1774945 RepID=A0A6I4IFG3_9FLAO|nr:hypothetical protein [Flavobacterium profundi]MVO08483.1 hypothetical protein [Flavobacterium profundi]